MKKISVQLYFADDQYDVLVTDETGEENEALTDYAFASKEEANAYITTLRTQYDVTYMDEIDEEGLPTYDVHAFIQPRYVTYILKEGQLKETLETLFFKKNGFRISLSVVFDSEYIYINLDKKASDELKNRVSRLYGGLDDFSEDLLDDVFDSAGVMYSVPMEDFGGVHILVPYEPERMR